MSDPFNDLNRKLFLDQMNLFKIMYRGFAKCAQKEIMGLIALKHSINKQKEMVYETFGENEKREFDELLEELILSFNPDIYLNNLDKSLLCITFSQDSYLSIKYGTKEICGKYLGLIDGVVTKIKSKKTGNYEEKESSISFRFAYPTIDDIINVAYYDLQGMSEF